MLLQFHSALYPPTIIKQTQARVIMRKSSDPIKPGLHLSQSTLQDFEECPRKFQLKVIDNVTWPAANLEPLSKLERATDLGNQFHQLCQQVFSGIGIDLISSSIVDPDLVIMWENFIPLAQDLVEAESFSEITLSTPFLNHQLVVKFDLVVKSAEDRFTIYDWKTAAKKPPRTHLSNRFQTVLYPFVFHRAGSGIFKTGQPSPDAISMHYWYPLSSDPEEIFPYSNEIYEGNLIQLTKSIQEMDALLDSEKTFPLTDDLEICRQCVYRSLCERGTRASVLDLFNEIESEDLSNEHFDLDSIDEILF